MLLATLLFFGLTVTLFLLPFVPGLRELRRQEDARPLHISREADVDIRHFERGFRSFMGTYLQEAIGTCRSSGLSNKGTLSDGTPYLIVGDDDPPLLVGREQRSQSSERLILSCGELSLPEESSWLGEIYSAESIQGGKRNIYRAILAEKDIHLDGESAVLRWLHSEGSVFAGRECVFYGRCSAADFIHLDLDCIFERMHAPRIEFGPSDPNSAPSEAEARERTRIKPEDLPHLANFSAGRALVHGNLRIPPDSEIDFDLVVTGKLRICSGSHLRKSVKSHRDLHVEDNVRVDGALVSGHNLELRERCSIHGPLLAEGDLLMGKRCRVGSHESPTSISVEGAIVNEGCITHGTIWAHKFGRVAETIEEPAAKAETGGKA